MAAMTVFALLRITVKKKITEKLFLL